MTSSGSTASASPAQLTDIRSLVADLGASRSTSTSCSPGLSSAMPSLERADAQLGPGQVLEDRHLAAGRAPTASRTRSAFSACSSRSPWEKFSRATSRPASTIRASVSGSREAGPMVATIFVRRMRATAR